VVGYLKSVSESEHSPPRRGGVDVRSIRSREATLFRTDGVVSSAPIQAFAGLTTPSAPIKDASRHLFDVAATPPLRGGECRNFQIARYPDLNEIGMPFVICAFLWLFRLFIESIR
jgi:hypothetical protein